MPREPEDPKTTELIEIFMEERRENRTGRKRAGGSVLHFRGSPMGALRLVSASEKIPTPCEHAIGDFADGTLAFE